MRWHVSAYTDSLAAVTNDDVPAAPDQILGRRNNHLIFTEPYNLLGLFGTGTTLTRSRFANAALTQKGSNHHWPLERTATIGDLPQIMDLRNAPLAIPQNEELTIEASTDAAGPARTEFLLWLGKPEWNQNWPGHLDRFTTRATAVVAAGAEGAWGLDTDLVFERDLLNGVYAVVGAYVVAAAAMWFRFYFPDAPSEQGKVLRPGGLVQNALGDQPNREFNNNMGEWGRFHTFTPPLVQLFGDAAGGTYEVRLDLLYLGQDESLVFQY